MKAISQARTQELQTILQDEFGLELTLTEAEQWGQQLLHGFEALARIAAHHPNFHTSQTTSNQHNENKATS